MEVHQRGYLQGNDSQGWYSDGMFTELSVEVEPGYAFDGWYWGDKKISEEENFIYQINEPTMLSAVATPEKYPLSFEYDGGADGSNEI